jgi:hypothetical protein
MRSLPAVATKETATMATAIVKAAMVAETTVTVTVEEHLGPPGHILVPGQSPDRNRVKALLCYKKGWEFLPILFIVTEAWKNTKYLKT